MLTQQICSKEQCERIVEKYKNGIFAKKNANDEDAAALVVNGFNFFKENNPVLMILEEDPAGKTLNEFLSAIIYYGTSYGHCSDYSCIRGAMFYAAIVLAQEKNAALRAILALKFFDNIPEKRLDKLFTPIMYLAKESQREAVEFYLTHKDYYEGEYRASMGAIYGGHFDFANHLYLRTIKNHASSLDIYFRCIANELTRANRTNMTLFYFNNFLNLYIKLAIQIDNNIENIKSRLVEFAYSAKRIAEKTGNNEDFLYFIINIDSDIASEIFLNCWINYEKMDEGLKKQVQTLKGQRARYDFGFFYEMGATLSDNYGKMFAVGLSYLLAIRGLARNKMPPDIIKYIFSYIVKDVSKLVEYNAYIARKLYESNSKRIEAGTSQNKANLRKVNEIRMHRLLNMQALPSNEETDRVLSGSVEDETDESDRTQITKDIMLAEAAEIDRKLAVVTDNLLNYFQGLHLVSLADFILNTFSDEVRFYVVYALLELHKNNRNVCMSVNEIILTTLENDATQAITEYKSAILAKISPDRIGHAMIKHIMHDLTSNQPINQEYFEFIPKIPLIKNGLDNWSRIFNSKNGYVKQAWHHLEQHLIELASSKNVKARAKALHICETLAALFDSNMLDMGKINKLYNAISDVDLNKTRPINFLDFDRTVISNHRNFTFLPSALRAETKTYRLLMNLRNSIANTAELNDRAFAWNKKRNER